MLARAGFALVHVPGIAVNRARQGTVGGENKSDPRDARTIADQVRTRSDLRPIEPAAELDLEIRLLVSRCGDIVQAQTQRLSRMRDLLVGTFPGLEACFDLKTSATWRSDCEAAGGGATGGGLCTCLYQVLERLTQSCFARRDDDLIQGGERMRFAMATPLRSDFDASGLRVLARNS